jgi:SRSO17 transposase
MMLPGSRTDGEVFSIPQFSLAQGDVEGFLHEWRGFHEVFHECFARREPREQFFGYMVGQFSAFDRQSIEPMALQVDGGNVRAMQRLISDVVWDEVQMRRMYHSLLNDDLGDADGGLIVDESGFPKKGRE